MREKELGDGQGTARGMARRTARGDADQKQNQKATSKLDRHHEATGPHRPEGHPQVPPPAPLDCRAAYEI
jgi:hypothetical protein